ncbi:dd9872fc-fcd0-4e49-8f6e-e010586ed128 [Thermothielavioides terrestris]|uniref:Dd9872fc-fcd0-4e49-8f6e-e010586ed128 n=1 Tax=Thermothielavioides terrestris TaxID=2587410 RepID=A0A446BL72_9PEZI|nr:dd9872fc-fcd0-4e49-8f6e-e010586ed128 [Thermothielavioides terrestris]
MEQIRRRNLEVAQFKQLCALKKYIHRHSPPTIDDSELEALGVLKRTDLDVDNSSPCDFEPRFFSPWYDGDSDLKEEGDGARVYWSETLDRDKDHPEWIPNAGYKYPEMRARWFNREDLDFSVPYRHDYRSHYVTEAVMLPTAADTPHTGITMFDPVVAPEGTMLRSELHAAVTLLREQVRSGRFTDHHTKPVLVLSYQWETHGRITQAHIDAKLNKLVIRQSRLLDFKAKQPTPDAYIFLRWLINRPVGATKYVSVQDDDDPPQGRDRLEAGPPLVEVESR